MLMLGMALCSCEDWFNVSPKTEMKGDDMFSDERGFRDALIGAYSLMTEDGLYGKEMVMGFTEVLAQSYDGLSTSINSPYLNASKYLYNEASEEGRLRTVWKTSYKVIANINGMLAKIEAQKDVFSPGMYGVVKGEALALRGFLHFDLLRLYAPVPELGKDEPAIPYVDRYTNQAFPRLTVNQAFQRVLRDVDSARYYLGAADMWRPRATQEDSVNFSTYFNKRQSHLNYYAATALKARVKLWQGEKAEAFELAKEVITCERFPLISENVMSATRLFPKEHIFSIYKNKLKELLENLYTQGTGGGILPLTEAKIDGLYNNESVNTDLRKTWWFENSKIVKFDNAASLPLIRIPEMYLIAAECAPSTTIGLTFLNTLRIHRNLPEYDDPGDDRDGFERVLDEEIRRELFLEGQLFYYFKRNNLSKLPGLSEPIDPRLVYCPPIPSEEFEFGNMD